MNLTREQINPVPYEVEIARDGGKLVEITIRAVRGGELTYPHVRNAMHAVLDLVPRRGGEPAGGRPRDRRAALAREAETVAELELPVSEMAMLLAAHEAAGGRVTDEYLARLSLAYDVAARRHRDVSARLATALDRPLQTVKGHLMRARKEGFLSPAEEGREGGVATSKALDVIVASPQLPRHYRRDFGLNQAEER